MEVLGLQIFVSLMLVVGSLLLFAFSAKQRDHEHNDRLALLPLENDSVRPFHAPTELACASVGARVRPESDERLAPPPAPASSDERWLNDSDARVAHAASGGR